MLRSHDLVVADGTFRVVMTPRRHVFAVLDVRTSPLGPLHVALNVDRSPRIHTDMPPEVFGDPSRESEPGVIRAIEAESDHTFEEASDYAPEIAEPIIRLTRNAAEEGAEFIWRAHHPTHLDRQHAAHLLMRVRLGDLEARRRVHRIIEDARAGIEGAQGLAAALMEANAMVTEVVDVPVANVARMHAAGAPLPPSPIDQYHRVTHGVRHGNWGPVATFLKDHSSDILHRAASMVPGIGRGLSEGIGAGNTALNHDHPIDIALRSAYGAIHVPPGDARKASDHALHTVLGFVENPHNLTHGALHSAREQLPHGVPRDVFDTLTHVLVRHVPIQHDAGALAGSLAPKHSFPTHGLPPVAHNQHVPAVGEAAAHIGEVLHSLALKGKSA